MSKSVYENFDDLQNVTSELSKWDFLSSKAIICGWIEILAMKNNMTSNDLANTICEMIRSKVGGNENEE